MVSIFLCGLRGKPDLSYSWLCFTLSVHRFVYPVKGATGEKPSPLHHPLLSPPFWSNGEHSSNDSNLVSRTKIAGFSRRLSSPLVSDSSRHDCTHKLCITHQSVTQIIFLPLKAYKGFLLCHGDLALLRVPILLPVCLLVCLSVALVTSYLINLFVTQKDNLPWCSS